MKKKLFSSPFLYAFTGLFSGLLLFHPFIMIINDLFHWHMEEKYWHLHFNTLVTSFLSSYTFPHLPHILAFSLLPAIVGYFVGKVINEYKIIDEQTQRFAKIGQNASSIVHDLNNPLTGIIGFSEILRLEDPEMDEKKRCEYMTIIHKNALHIAGMIREIKILAKDEGKLSISLAKMPVRPFVEKSISSMHLRVPIRVTGDPDIEAFIDPPYFERVVWNLVKNAEEAMNGQKNGFIKIAVFPTEETVNIAFMDNGPGLPGQIRKAPFKIGNTYGKAGGSGLGLYTCKIIVEAHNGTIWFDSEKGYGTSFYVQLPAVHGNENVLPFPADPASPGDHSPIRRQRLANDK